MKNAVLLVVLMAACSGCPPQPKPTNIDLAAPPTQPDMSNYGLQVCPAVPNVTFANICDGWFTQTGLSCANCPGEQSCFDSTDVIYCVGNGPGCSNDANCFYVKDGDPGAPGAATKRKVGHPIKKVPSKLTRKS